MYSPTLLKTVFKQADDRMKRMADIPEKFDGIRPYEDHELQEVIDRLFDDSSFSRNLKYLLGHFPLWMFRLYLKLFRTIDSFQAGVVIPWLNRILKKQSGSLDFDFDALAKDRQDVLFISNHRDIVLDSAILDRILLNQKKHSAHIAIGNNLLIYPWIEMIVRLNRSFIVNRSAEAQELLESSRLLSEYISYVITERKMPVWIAQREGRAKDSNDRTQRSVLKMLAMSDSRSDVREALASLHICPLSISYEYDPCDWLKAQEFQLKRDDPAYRKSKKDDLDNMRTGISGYKGHIHYYTSGPIDDEIMKIDASLPRNVQLDRIAAIIDRHIFQGYRIYPCNRIALDMLRNSSSQSSLYTEEQKSRFISYIDGQIAKISIPNPDVPFLKNCMLTMYANPLINQIECK